MEEFCHLTFSAYNLWDFLGRNNSPMHARSIFLDQVMIYLLTLLFSNFFKTLYSALPRESWRIPRESWMILREAWPYYILNAE
jgi:hypothetical protein